MTSRPKAHGQCEPDLEVAGLCIWVHGRQFPDSSDEFDGNWLVVTARCVHAGASVVVRGPIVSTVDIAGFVVQCDAMHRSTSNSAVLAPFEPALEVTLEASDDHGHVAARVRITPDHLVQSHEFRFEIDQSWLPLIVRQCEAIVARFPIRGRAAGGSDEPLPLV
jgi:hypothetical protein